MMPSLNYDGVLYMNIFTHVFYTNVRTHCCVFVCYFLALIPQDGETAVMIAAERDESECLQLLLEGNANLNLQNNVRPVMFTCTCMYVCHVLKENPSLFEYS